MSCSLTGYAFCGILLLSHIGGLGMSGVMCSSEPGAVVLVQEGLLFFLDTNALVLGPWGGSIHAFAKSMVRFYKEAAALYEHEISVRTSFNDCILIAGEGTSAEDIVGVYDRFIEESCGSPEVVEACRQRDEDVRHCQVRLDALVRELFNGQFDVHDIRALLDWLYRLGNELRAEVELPSEDIAAYLSEVGYRVHENTGDEFDGEDALNFGHYIVGQALAFLGEHNTFHGLIMRAIEDWRAKFPVSGETVSLGKTLITCPACGVGYTEIPDPYICWAGCKGSLVGAEVSEI